MKEIEIQNSEIIKRIISIYKLERTGDAALALLICIAIAFNLSMGLKLLRAICTNPASENDDSMTNGDDKLDETRNRRNQRQKLSRKEL